MSGTLRRGWRVGLITAGLVSALHGPAEAQTRSGFEKERRELAQKLETTRRLLPDASDPTAEEARVRALARRVGLAVSDVRRAGSAELRDAEGRPTVELHHLEVSGRDRYQKVHEFLSGAAHHAPMIGLEALRLKAAASDTVSFTARLGLPCFTGRVESQAATDSGFPWKGIPAEQREAYLRDLGLFRAKVELITSLKARQDPSVVRALATLTRGAWDSAVALTELRLDGEVSAEGIILGGAARAGLKAVFEKAGLRVNSLWTQPFGTCRSFSVRAGLAPAEEPAEGVLGNGLFSDRAAEVCRVGSVSSAGPAAAWKASGGGGLTLRLRDVDLVDVFSALHDLTRQNFVIDPDVTGRVSVDLDDVTLEQALAGAASAGIAVGPPGAIRRVSRSVAPPAPSPARYTGAPISFSFKGGDLRDILTLFGEVSGLKVSGPRGLEGRVNVFVRDLPWDQVLDAVLSSAGLSYRREKDRLIIGSAAAVKARRGAGEAAASDAFEPLTGVSWRRWTPRLPEHAAADLELAGLARTAGDWTAYLYGPTRWLLAVKAGQALFDARVSSVGPSGITIETDDWGMVDVPLQPASLRAPFTVSRETTYLVGPLREDGSVDYLAALDERYGQGISAENNAAGLLLSALGPRGVPAASQRRLGLAPLPEEGEYFRTALHGSYLEELARREGRDPKATREAFLSQHRRAITQPWKEDECPLVAGWVRANERPLERVVAATRLSRWWLPLSGDESSYAVPGLVQYREAANALVARALSRLGAGDRRGAWADLIAAHRLAGLLSQGPTLIERLVGLALRGIANDGVAALLAAGPVPAGEARGFLADLRSLPPLPGVREALQVTERCFTLAGWTRLARVVARRGPFAWSEAFPDTVGDWLNMAEPPPPLPPLAAAAVDWDLVLRTVNRSVDASLGDPQAKVEVEEAAGAPPVEWERMTPADRAAALQRLAQGQDPEMRRRISLALAAQPGAGLLRAQVSGNEVEAQFRLPLLGLALAAHRAERGRFPDRLVDLAPEALGAGVRAEGARDGYVFRYQPGADGGGFVYTATPEVQNETGVREFCLDAAGRLLSVTPPARVRVVDGACSVEPATPDRKP